VSVLLGKCNAVTRRLGESFIASKISLDASKQIVYIRGSSVVLTRNELRLMSIFLQNAGQVLMKEQLLQALWDVDGNFVDENTLAVNIRRLREKIEQDPSHPALIETIRGMGYRLRCDK